MKGESMTVTERVQQQCMLDLEAANTLFEHSVVTRELAKEIERKMPSMIIAEIVGLREFVIVKAYEKYRELASLEEFMTFDEFRRTIVSAGGIDETL
jgi:hypothetical protein